MEKIKSFRFLVILLYFGDFFTEVRGYTTGEDDWSHNNLKREYAPSKNANKASESIERREFSGAAAKQSNAVWLKLLPMLRKMVPRKFKIKLPISMTVAKSKVNKDGTYLQANTKSQASPEPSKFQMQGRGFFIGNSSTGEQAASRRTESEEDSDSEEPSTTSEPSKFPMQGRGFFIGRSGAGDQTATRRTESEEDSDSEESTPPIEKLGRFSLGGEPASPSGLKTGNRTTFGQTTTKSQTTSEPTKVQTLGRGLALPNRKLESDEFSARSGSGDQAASRGKENNKNLEEPPPPKEISRFSLGEEPKSSSVSKAKFATMATTTDRTAIQEIKIESTSLQSVDNKGLIGTASPPVSTTESHFSEETNNETEDDTKDMTSRPKPFMQGRGFFGVNSPQVNKVKLDERETEEENEEETEEETEDDEIKDTTPAISKLFMQGKGLVLPNRKLDSDEFSARSGAGAGSWLNETEKGSDSKEPTTPKEKLGRFSLGEEPKRTSVPQAKSATIATTTDSIFIQELQTESKPLQSVQGGGLIGTASPPVSATESNFSEKLSTKTENDMKYTTARPSQYMQGRGFFGVNTSQGNRVKSDKSETEESTEDDEMEDTTTATSKPFMQGKGLVLPNRKLDSDEVSVRSGAGDPAGSELTDSEKDSDSKEPPPPKEKLGRFSLGEEPKNSSVSKDTIVIQEIKVESKSLQNVEGGGLIGAASPPVSATESHFSEKLSNKTKNDTEDTTSRPTPFMQGRGFFGVITPQVNIVKSDKGDNESGTSVESVESTEDDEMEEMTPAISRPFMQGKGLVLPNRKLDSEEFSARSGAGDQAGSRGKESDDDSKEPTPPKLGRFSLGGEPAPPPGSKARNRTSSGPTTVKPKVTSELSKVEIQGRVLALPNKKPDLDDVSARSDGGDQAASNRTESDEDSEEPPQQKEKLGRFSLGGEPAPPPGSKAKNRTSSGPTTGKPQVTTELSNVEMQGRVLALPNKKLNLNDVSARSGAGDQAASNRTESDEDSESNEDSESDEDSEEPPQQNEKLGRFLLGGEPAPPLGLKTGNRTTSGQTTVKSQTTSEPLKFPMQGRGLFIAIGRSGAGDQEASKRTESKEDSDSEELTPPTEKLGRFSLGGEPAPPPVSKKRNRTSSGQTTVKFQVISEPSEVQMQGRVLALPNRKLDSDEVSARSGTGDQSASRRTESNENSEEPPSPKEKLGQFSLGGEPTTPPPGSKTRNGTSSSQASVKSQVISEPPKVELLGRRLVLPNKKLDLDEVTARSGAGYETSSRRLESDEDSEEPTPPKEKLGRFSLGVEPTPPPGPKTRNRTSSTQTTVKSQVISEPPKVEMLGRVLALPNKKLDLDDHNAKSGTRDQGDPRGTESDKDSEESPPSKEKLGRFSLGEEPAPPPGLKTGNRSSPGQTKIKFHTTSEPSKFPMQGRGLFIGIGRSGAWDQANTRRTESEEDSDSEEHPLPNEKLGRFSLGREPAPPPESKTRNRTSSSQVLVKFPTTSEPSKVQMQGRVLALPNRKLDSDEVSARFGTGDQSASLRTESDKNSEERPSPKEKLGRFSLGVEPPPPPGPKTRNRTTFGQTTAKSQTTSGPSIFPMHGRGLFMGRSGAGDQEASRRTESEEDPDSEEPLPPNEKLGRFSLGGEPTPSPGSQAMNRTSSSQTTVKPQATSEPSKIPMQGRGFAYPNRMLDSDEFSARSGSANHPAFSWTQSDEDSEEPPPPAGKLGGFYLGGEPAPPPGLKTKNRTSSFPTAVKPQGRILSILATPLKSTTDQIHAYAHEMTNTTKSADENSGPRNDSSVSLNTTGVPQKGRGLYAAATFLENTTDQNVDLESTHKLLDTTTRRPSFVNNATQPDIFNIDINTSLQLMQGKGTLQIHNDKVSNNETTIAQNASARHAPKVHGRFMFGAVSLALSKPKSDHHNHHVNNSVKLHTNQHDDTHLKIKGLLGTGTIPISSKTVSSSTQSTAKI